MAYEMTVIVRAGLIASIVAVGWHESEARADDTTPASSASESESVSASLPPWHDGVKAKQKQRAGSLYERASALYEEHEYTQALDAYLAALAEWDNPDIHNALGNLYFRKLGQPRRAFEHFRRALAWGPEALTASQRADATEIVETLLSERLGRMQIRSEQEGVEVSLNGEVLFTGPGEKSVVLVPGNQLVSAKKAGHFPVIETIMQRPGQDQAVAVTLSEDRVDSRRRWATWLPWTVLGTGAAVGLVGGGLFFLANANVAKAEAAVSVDCGGAVSCPAVSNDLVRRGHIQSGVGIGAVAVGGVAVAAALVSVWLNRPVTERTADKSGASVLENQPLLWNGGAGWSVTGQF